MRKVKVDIKDVDDGVTVYHDGSEILHVHYMHEGSTQFDASSGDSVKVIIHNLTGGDWHARVLLKVSGKKRINKRIKGSSLIGQNEAWAKEITV